MTDSHSDEVRLIIYKQARFTKPVELLARDGRVWATQGQIAEIFGTSVPNINIHISKILKEKEFDKDSVIKFYLITAADGKTYDVAHYSLEMVLAIGFRVRSVRGTQFRQWAVQNLREYIVKGFVLDVDRLKNPDGRPDYFDELLEKIRDIRASEKRFYQKVRDLLALSSDYDADDKSTQMFFATVQNKLLYAVTKETAAEIIVYRSDPNAPNMGLTSWEGDRVRKKDIFTGKNYLRQDEIDVLNRIVVQFLEQAELRVRNRQDLTLDFWKENVDNFIRFNDMPVLEDKGSISREKMEKIVGAKYEVFDKNRKRYEAQLADEEDLKYLENIEKEIKERSKNDDDHQK